jgi:hypothetical protein
MTTATAVHNRTDYRLVLDHPSGHKFYIPNDTTAYHKSRELAMNGQDMFSRSGITPELLEQFAQLLLDEANAQNAKDKLRSNVAVIATNILLRLKDPIDEHCAIRMGAIALVHHDEDPDRCDRAWIKKKMDIAAQHPDIYSFFLHTGIAFTPEYSNLLRGLEAEDYLESRAQKLKNCQPITQ